MPSQSVKTYRHGIITVGSCQYFNYTTYTPARCFSCENTVSVLDLTVDYEEVVQKTSITVNRFNALTTANRALDYDWSTDIAEINNSTVWLWGSYTTGGVGLVYIGRLVAFIVSNGYYTSVSNPQVGRYYINYTQRADYSANKMSSVMFAYFNYRQIYASIINPLPTDAYGQYIRIMVNYDSQDPTNQDAVRHKYAVPTLESNRGYEYDPGGMPWDNCYASPNFDNSIGILTSQTLTYKWIYPYRPMYLENGSYWNNSTQGILDDERFGVSGLNHESGHWYGAVDENDNEGGDGDGDDDQGGTQPEHVPAIPVSVTDTGFVRLYNPITAELRGLSNFMFATLTTNQADVLKKLLANPLDYILCLNVCHFTVPTSGRENIHIGGIDTEVQTDIVPSQWVHLSGGKLTLNEYWGNYLDYAPYTKAQLHIPYCGTHELDIDLVMRSTLYLDYEIDLLSGSMVARLGIVKDNDLSNQPNSIGSANNPINIENYTGNIFTPIPLASTDYRNMVSSVLGIASSAVTSLASSNPLPLASGVANAVTNSKSSVSKNGSLSNSYGYMSNQDAFLILSRPCLTMKEEERTKFHDWMGYPCNMVKPVGDFSGVLTIQNGTYWNDLSQSITEEEKEEIATLFAEGVCV